MGVSGATLGTASRVPIAKGSFIAMGVQGAAPPSLRALPKPTWPPHGTLSSPSFHKLNVDYAPSLGEEYKIGVLEPQQQFSNLVCARVWLGARV